MLTKRAATGNVDGAFFCRLFAEFGELGTIGQTVERRKSEKAVKIDENA